MSKLIYRDHRSDTAGWARELGISREAVEVYLACESIDLHVDSFIWNRILRYDLRARHGDGITGARQHGHQRVESGDGRFSAQ